MSLEQFYHYLGNSSINTINEFHCHPHHHRRGFRRFSYLWNCARSLAPHLLSDDCFLLKKGPFNMFLPKKYLQLILIKGNS